MKGRTASTIGLCTAFSILALGFTVAGIYGARRIPELIQVTARGVVPPGFVAVLGKQKEYTVWLAIEDEEDESGDKADRVTFLPPSAEVEVIDLSNGKQIELVHKVPIRRHAGGELTVSIAEFESERPGQQIQLKASGLAESVTLSVMPTNIGQVLRVSIGLVGISVVTIAAAFSVFYWISRRTGDSSGAVE